MIETLELIAHHVRGFTIQLLEAAPEGLLTWAPDGLSNHTLWHAGHALWGQDVLSLQRLAGRSGLPEGWGETFGEHCRPPRETQDWPSRGHVLELLHAQLDRFITLVRASEQKLKESQTNPQLVAGWPLLEGVVHAWHDEARHHGEMYLLRKMYAAKFMRGVG